MMKGEKVRKKVSKNARFSEEKYIGISNSKESAFDHNIFIKDVGFFFDFLTPEQCSLLISVIINMASKIAKF